MRSLGLPSTAAAVEPAAEEGRRGERRPVSLSGFAIRADGSTIEIGLRDLHYDGCGIDTPSPLRQGEPLKLSVVGRGLIEVVVCWYKNGRAGLRFLSAEPEAKKRHIPRRHDRASLSYEIRLRRIGQATYNVRIFDLSPSGCKIEVVERPRVGEQMMVKFEGLETLQAEVCWIDEFVVGLRFERPLHPAVFDLLLTRLG